MRRPPAARTERLRVHVRSNGLGRSRLGVSVGRRFGNAVARNGFRRIVREAFRTSPEVRAAGFDVVVVAGRRDAFGRPVEVAEVAETLRSACEAAAGGRPAG